MYIILALLLGGFFGFTLHAIGASNPQLIINMLRLKNLYLMKVILLAIGVSSFFLFAGLKIEVIPISHLFSTNANLGVLLGGAIFGLGWGISGYCPGTSLVALASLRRDAVAFIAGGLVGSWIYVMLFNLIGKSILFKDLFGIATLSSIEKYGDFLPFLIAIILMAIAFILPLPGFYTRKI